MFSFVPDNTENPFGEMMREVFSNILSTSPIPHPVKVLVCDDNTTVFWDNGKVTQVRRMTKKRSGIEAVNSTEDAVAFALVKLLTADWIDSSAIERDEDDGSILDDGRRNWMKAALRKVEVLPSRKELRAAKVQLKLEAEEAKTKLLPATVKEAVEEVISKKKTKK